MTLEFRFRSVPFAKEHELIEKINNLLSAITSEQPKNQKSSTKSVSSDIAPRRINQRAHSLCPKYTLFQFSLPLPLSHDKPIISTPHLTTTIPPSLPHVKQPRMRKVYKPKISTFIKAKNTANELPHNISPGRYQKILNLTQSLIDKEHIRGWN